MTLIPPSRVFSFETFDNQNPVQKPPGDRLDAQFASHADAINSIIDFLSNLLRSDGKLANDIVHLQALSPTLRDTLTAEIGAKVDPQVTRAVAAAVTSDQNAAFVENALTTVTNRVSQALQAADQVNAASGTALERAIQARQDTEIALQTLQQAQLDLFNNQETIKAGAGESEQWAIASMQWAEYMGGTIPAETIAWMGITGDHWSSRWWANQCTIIAGDVSDDADNVNDIWEDFAALYLGAFQLPPDQDALGRPIVPGAMYFDTDDNTMYVWTGTAWQPMTGDVGVATIANVGSGAGVYLQTIASNVQLRSIRGSGHLSVTENTDTIDLAVSDYAWSEITGKPSTFPPTLPIPSSGVTGLDTAQANQDSLISGLQTNKVAKAGDTMTGALVLPAAAPTLATHATNKSYVDAQISTLSSAITAGDAVKVAKAGDTMTGDLIVKKAAAQIVSDGTGAASSGFELLSDGVYRWGWNLINDPADDLGLTQFSGTGQGITGIPVKVSRATSVVDFSQTPTVNGKPLIGGATISETAPGGAVPGQFWWESDATTGGGGLYLYYSDANSSQWVQVNAPSLPDAPADTKPYARQNNAWFDLTATLAAKADANAYLPLAGGSLTGVLATNSTISSTAVISSTVNVSGSYAAVFTNNNTSGGGVIGYSGSYYGICGYAGFSFYGNGPILANGGNFGAALNMTAIANTSLCWGNDTIFTTSSAYWQFAFGGTVHYRMEGTIFRTLQDNNKALGASSYRWTTVYAVTGTINTSDEREKQDIRPLNEAELRVARALKPLICAYRWKDRVTEKGPDARIHVGIIAQRVQEAFVAEGLDVSQYGLWCADPVMNYVHPVREEDPVTKEVRTITEGYEEDTGEIRYGVRYDELAMFILGGL